MLYIQFSTVIGCLLVSSVLDLIKREVSDIPWIILALEGIITTIVFIIFTENRRGDGILIGINFVIGIVMGFLLFYTGVMGGADAKAIMALSVNTAVYPFPFELTQLDVYQYIPGIFNIFFAFPAKIFSFSSTGMGMAFTPFRFSRTKSSPASGPKG